MLSLYTHEHEWASVPWLDCVLHRVSNVYADWSSSLQLVYLFYTTKSLVNARQALLYSCVFTCFQNYMRFYHLKQCRGPLGYNKAYFLCVRGVVDTIIRGVIRQFSSSCLAERTGNNEAGSLAFVWVIILVWLVIFVLRLVSHSPG